MIQFERLARIKHVGTTRCYVTDLWTTAKKFAKIWGGDIEKGPLGFWYIHI